MLRKWCCDSSLSTSLLDPKDETNVNSNSTWTKDLAAEYDLCIIFPAVNGEFTEKGNVRFILCLYF
jgi:hypothetical protein